MRDQKKNMTLDKENERKNDSGPPVKTNRRGNTGRVRNVSPPCREIPQVVRKSPNAYFTCLEGP